MSLTNEGYEALIESLREIVVERDADLAARDERIAELEALASEAGLLANLSVLKQERDAVHARIAALEGALRPFAEALQPSGYLNYIHIKHYKQAAALLRDDAKEDGDEKEAE